MYPRGKSVVEHFGIGWRTAPVAHSVEHPTSVPAVLGSSPTLGGTFSLYSLLTHFFIRQSYDVTIQLNGHNTDLLQYRFREKCLSINLNTFVFIKAMQIYFCIYINQVHVALEII